MYKATFIFVIIGHIYLHSGASISSAAFTTTPYYDTKIYTDFCQPGAEYANLSQYGN